MKRDGCVTGASQLLSAEFDGTNRSALLVAIYQQHVSASYSSAITKLTARIVLKGKKVDKGVTNVRNVASPHWRRGESRCLVPFTRFSEHEVVCRSFDYRLFKSGAKPSSTKVVSKSVA